MMAAPQEPRAWSRRRWVGFLLLVLAAQIGSIYWLSNRSPVRARPVVGVPALRLVTNLIGPGQVQGDATAELLALGDPTLFALPHEQSFSGSAWMTLAPPQFEPVDWSEPPRWLPTNVETLGADFNRFMQTNRFASSQRATRPEPQLTLNPLPPLAAGRPPSTLRIEGGLIGRRLLKALALPSWATTNILRNTQVQLLVDADGLPVSVSLRGSCGWEAADQGALGLARAARFEPTSRGGPGAAASPTAQLTWGQMIFEWQTLPPPTDVPPQTPQP